VRTASAPSNPTEPSPIIALVGLNAINSK